MDLVVGAESSWVDGVAWGAADPADTGDPGAVVLTVPYVAAQVAEGDAFLRGGPVCVRAEDETALLGNGDGNGGGEGVSVRGGGTGEGEDEFS